MRMYDHGVSRFVYPLAEKVFRHFERKMYSRGVSISRIPSMSQRGGGLGTVTYGEWCQSIGMFQTLIFANLPKHGPYSILDIGCGIGRIYLSYLPYMTKNDRYTGIDVNPEFIKICQENFQDPNSSFMHLESHNGYYAPNEKNEQMPWNFESNSFNIITATSVWTHLTEKDWRFYLSEVGRVLAPGGRAIISFFILDDAYYKSLPMKDGKVSPFYPQPRNKWIFDKSIDGSTDWFCPSWAAVPETAVGVSEKAFDAAVSESGLTIHTKMAGAWKDLPGFHFQDFVVFEKPIF